MAPPTFIITKKIAKHGKQAVIVIPQCLISKLSPRKLVQVTIELLDEEEEE